jgi:hypothetical protein
MRIKNMANNNAGGAVAQSQNDPVYSLPFLYISGLNISVASTTVLAIAPGQARDSNDVMDMPVSFPNLAGVTNPAVLFQGYQQPLFLNAAVNGVNGLDAGSLTASTQYAIYLIGDSRGYNNVAGIITLSSNAYPLIPAGYDSFRLLGFIVTDVSSHFVAATGQPQLMANALSYFLSPAVSVLSGGNATSFTAVDCSTASPAGNLPNVILEMLVTFIPASANDSVQFRPTGSSDTTGLSTIVGAVAGVAQTQYIQIIAGVGSSKTEFDYKVSSSSDSVSISIVGWTGAPHEAYPV